jgi:hypothetical protein
LHSFSDRPCQRPKSCNPETEPNTPHCRPHPQHEIYAHTPAAASYAGEQRHYRGGKKWPGTAFITPTRVCFRRMIGDDDDDKKKFGASHSDV